MNDSRYQFEKVIALKVFVENLEGKILLIQEPETNQWMPGRWGLLGGKPLLKESLYQTFKRKMQEELGQNVEPHGIYKIEELLEEGKTVLMFHAVVKVPGNTEIKGTGQAYKWVGEDEIESMDIAEFTEFYNKKLLLDYLSGNREVIDFDLIETQNYYDLDEDPEFKRWQESSKSDNDKQQG